MHVNPVNGLCKIRRELKMQGSLRFLRPALFSLFGLLLGLQSAVAAPAHVQGGNNSSLASSTTITVTLRAPIANADAIAGYVTWDSTGGAALLTVKDDKNNSYTVVDNINDTGDGQSTATFYLVNITNWPKTITATFSKSIGWRALLVDEYSGIATSAALDGHRSSLQMGVGTGANAASSGSFATTRAGDLIYGVILDINPGTANPRAGTGFTQRQSTGTTNWMPMVSEDNVQSASGNTTATFTSGEGNATFGTAAMAFAAANSQPPPPPPPPPPGTYTYDFVKDFGAVCNGTPAQNDAAFQAFSVEAQKRTRPPEGSYPGYPSYYANASKDNEIVLNIPACNKFQYTWNKFGQSIRHLKIVGAGSGLHGGAATVLQNVNSDGSYFDELSMEGNPDYFALDVAPWADYGDLITTANAGATAVTLITHSNATKYTVGRWALVMSYSQQWYGYPPNMRYYDWAKVTAVNPSSGTITLDTPLRFTHRSDRPTDSPGFAAFGVAVGPAAIVAIDRPDKPVAEYSEFDGVHVLGNPHWNVSGVPQDGADVWQLSGIIDGAMNDFWSDYNMGHTQIRNFTISNSQWLDDESDKIINSITYQNDNVPQGSANHAGQLLWHVIGGTLGSTNIAAMNVKIEGGTVITNFANSLAGVQLDDMNYTSTVSIDGATFVGTGSGWPPISGPQSNQVNTPTVTVDGTVVSLPNGQGTSRLRIQKDLDTYASPSERVVDNWGDGAAIMKNGSFVPGATVSVITGDTNYVYVDVNGTTFRNGDQVYAAKVQSLSMTNNVGQNTGFNWSSSKSVNHYQNIPTITWSGNNGN
jgi:hypothetical protein